MLPLTVAIATKQMDLKMFLEQTGKRPPVASIDRDSIRQWASEMRYTSTCIGDNALRICQPNPKNWESGDPYTGYDQIWVKREYTLYREVLLSHLRPLVRADEDFADMDADHVVARVRLGAIVGAWVNLFPVRRSWNMFFGGVEARPEYELRAHNFENGLYLATGFEILKVISNNINELVNVAQSSLLIENPACTGVKAEMEPLRFL